MAIPQESNAIEFGTYVGRDAQTRASVTELDDLKTAGFGVWAYYTKDQNWSTIYTPNFMWNQQVTWEDPDWKYYPIKYWPTTQDEKLTFFAYAPYDDKDGSNYGIKPSGNDTAGTPTITFTINKDAANMVDLVTADGQTIVNSASPAKVVFSFNHILSRVNFKAKANDKTIDTSSPANLAEGTIINITDMQIDAGGEFYKSGTYKLKSTLDGNEGEGEWVGSDLFEETFNINSISAKEAVTHGAIEDKKYSQEGVKISSSTDVVPLFVSTKGSEQYLFLIPKEGGLSKDSVKVTFTYDIVTADKNLAEGYSITSATKTVALPKGSLQTGKAYDYTFIFGVDQVQVEANVVKWVDADNTDDTTVDFTDTDVTTP